MIVKVQLSLYTTAESQLVLVTNVKGKSLFEGSASKEVKRAMNGKKKAFFNARKDENGILHLEGMAKRQDYTW